MSWPLIGQVECKILAITEIDAFIASMERNSAPNEYLVDIAQTPEKAQAIWRPTKGSRREYRESVILIRSCGIELLPGFFWVDDAWCFFDPILRLLNDYIAEGEAEDVLDDRPFEIAIRNLRPGVALMTFGDARYAVDEHSFPLSLIQGAEAYAKWETEWLGLMHKYDGINMKELRAHFERLRRVEPS